MNEFFTVTQINRYLKNIIEAEPFLSDIWLRGEISNFKPHISGHLYLTLKDEQSVIKAVMFKGDTFSLKVKLKDGMKVFARCRIGVYEPGGSYQAYVKEFVADGIGEKHLAFEELKNRLEKQGLFDASHKKPIPEFPEKIGVVTSATGAAIQDIFNVLGRRYPIGEVVLYPSAVQGEGAPEEIINGIKYFNEECPVDVLIVGRGGGSIEDLWAFNDEGVAMAILSSKIPVISAVGHETDFTIADFVASLRAPTPSAAAELAATPVSEIKGNLEYFYGKLTGIIKEKVEKCELKVSALAMDKTLNTIKNNLQTKRLYLADIENRLFGAIKNKVELYSGQLQVASAKLDGNSPLKIMSKGYSAVTKNNTLIKSVKNVSVGEQIDIVMTDGTLSADITGIKGGKNNG